MSHGTIWSFAQLTPFFLQCRTKHVPNVNGLSLGTALRYGAIASGFGVATGIFALFFFDGVPRVKNDILSKIPIIGNHFVKEIAPEDNPF